MQKNIFHDSRHISEKDDQKKTTTAEQIKQKRRVDINKLLNRVRMDKKMKIKEKLFFIVQ